MKILDKETGEYKELRIKPGGDTLPIGTIVEYDGDTVPEGYEEVEEQGEIYSTEEVRIGTWKDGKPLYRKNITFENLSVTTYYSLNLGLSNVSIKRHEIIFDKTVSAVTGTDKEHSYYYLDTEYFRGFIRNNSTVEIRCASSSTTSFNLEVIVEYTKTTD